MDATASFRTIKHVQASEFKKKKKKTIFLSTMENSNSKKPRESQKPVVRIIASRNSNQPEIRINAAKETKTNAMEIITAMKSPFAPTISSADIQMPNVATLAIQRESLPTTPVAMIGTTTATATNNNIATTKTTKTIETTNSITTVIQHALSSKGKKATNNKKLPTTAANTRPTIPSPTMKSSPWKKSATLTPMIKTSSSNKTTYRKLPSVYSPMSLQNDTSISEP
jgi:hypothetical protein